jgi:hypothetical protein
LWTAVTRPKSKSSGPSTVTSTETSDEHVPASSPPPLLPLVPPLELLLLPPLEPLLEPMPLLPPEPLVEPLPELVLPEPLVPLLAPELPELPPCEPPLLVEDCRRLRRGLHPSRRDRESPRSRDRTLIVRAGAFHPSCG